MEHSRSSILNASIYLFLMQPNIIFVAKYIISTPLMMENPVRSPMVPPIAESMSTNLADLSLMMRSKVGVSK